VTETRQAAEQTAAAAEAAAAEAAEAAEAANREAAAKAAAADAAKKAADQAEGAGPFDTGLAPAVHEPAEADDTASVAIPTPRPRHPPAAVASSGRPLNIVPPP
jgi:hypothetical protein